MGPNNQLGGAKDGFTKVEYHVVTDDDVNTEPSAAAKNTNKNDKISFIGFFIFMAIAYFGFYYKYVL